MRAYRLQLGAAGVPGGAIDVDASAGVGANALRIRFSIKRNSRRAVNSAEIEITNLNREHRKMLGDLGSVRVRLAAGFASGGPPLAVLFDGDLTRAFTRREGPDLITRVSAGDGATALRQADIVRTFARGTTNATVLRTLGAALGIGAGNLDRAASGVSGTLPRALTLAGSVHDELEHFTRTLGLTWSIQSGALQLAPLGEAATGATIGPLLAPETGLIGEPTVEVLSQPLKAPKGGVVIGKGGLKVTGVCQLRGDLVPGTAFRLQSDVLLADLVCLATEHTGDSHSTSSAEWSTKWVGRKRA